VLAVAPDDRVAKLFIERAQALAAEPPPPEWDGTYVAKEK
jgi:adenylate cyclase